MRRRSIHAKRSQSRELYRGRVKRYMASSEWRRRRQQWVQEHRRRFGRDPRCAVCEAPWRDDARPLDERTLDLHHADYRQLGGERFEDLLPMCRDHHEVLHKLIESYPAFQRMSRREATRRIVPRLRVEWQKRRAFNTEKGAGE